MRYTVRMVNGSDRLCEFDKMQRQRILEAVESGEEHHAALERIKKETWPEYLRILQEYNDAPIFRSPFPSNDYEPPPRAA